MESDSSSHGRLMPYSTDCFAEFYDLWAYKWVLGKQFPDITIYWEAILSAMKSHEGQEGPITVVDIGSGTGRALRDVLERARDSETLLPNVNFWATDPGEAMLRRGELYIQRHPELKRIAPVKWEKASGEDFASVLPELKGSSDLIM